MRSRGLLALAAVLTLSPLGWAHGGHGQDGDASTPLRLALHYLREPQHAAPIAIAVALLAIVVLRRAADRDQDD